jgi:hypothetical protein
MVWYSWYSIRRVSFTIVPAKVWWLKLTGLFQSSCHLELGFYSTASEWYPWRIFGSIPLIRCNLLASITVHSSSRRLKYYLDAQLPLTKLYSYRGLAFCCLCGTVGCIVIFQMDVAQMTIIFNPGKGNSFWSQCHPRVNFGRSRPSPRPDHWLPNDFASTSNLGAVPHWTHAGHGYISSYAI